MAKSGWGVEGDIETFRPHAGDDDYDPKTDPTTNCDHEWKYTHSATLASITRKFYKCSKCGATKDEYI